MEMLFDHFIIQIYKLIFEHDPPYMSREAMEALPNIAYWYASPSGTFIKMFGRDKPPHVLPRFSMDKLVMQEVTYHISIGLLIGLHMRKKAPCPTLPLQIWFYDIKILKDVDEEAKEIVNFKFRTK